MTISPTDIRQQLQNFLDQARAGEHAAGEGLELLERLMVGVAGPPAAPVHDDVVGFGSAVTIEDLETGDRVRHRLMTADAMDLDAGDVTTDSPLGMALLGRAPGDVVEFETPGGTRRVRIVEMETLPAFLGILDRASSPDGSRGAAERESTVSREPRTGTYG
jgi:transcription elongation GreA/GreB family factor